MQEINDNINILQYLKDNYTKEEIFNNKKIFDMIQVNHEYNFNMDMRNSIEYLKIKYTNRYNYINIFKNDRNSINYERLYDIIYNNINKTYNYELIYDEPEKIIEILEKQ
jgi:hypothetical protein|tara:strand:+ start:536 stop:865 length:330 start_codon:yes stop_codon:yes gene_type:complete